MHPPSIPWLSWMLALAFIAGCAPRSGEDAAPPGAVPGPFEATVLPNGFAFPAHDTVRVMTWNLENFVDLHDNYRFFAAADRGDWHQNVFVMSRLPLIPSEAELGVLTEGSGSLDFANLLGPRGIPTHPSDDPVRQLDYLLVNPHMERRLVPGSAGAGAPFSVETLRLMSDHLPVMADFLFTGS